jgi:cytochrome c oxidase subunit IV
MNGVGGSWQLWKGPGIVWSIMLALLAASTASAYVPLGAANTALNLLIAAVMVLLLVLFLMDLRRSSTLLHLLAGAGLFWTLFMFALTFADYATRHY